jgi:hypothetical protein
MIGGHRRAYIGLVFATATLIASIWLYKSRPLAAITFGSTAVALCSLILRYWQLSLARSLRGVGD